MNSYFTVSVYVIRDTACALIRIVCLSDFPIFVDDAIWSIHLACLEVLGTTLQDAAEGNVDIFGSILFREWRVNLGWLASFEVYAILVEGIWGFGSCGDLL